MGISSSIGSVLSVLFGFAALGCAECERMACEKLTLEAKDDGEGLSGVIASESDVVANGCQECSFAEATATVYPVAAPVDEAGAQALVDAAKGETTTLKDEYFAPYPPGNYLVCVNSACVNVVVGAKTSTTFHVRLLNGPPSFYVASADGSIEEIDEVFAVRP